MASMLGTPDIPVEHFARFLDLCEWMPGAKGIRIRAWSKDGYEPIYTPLAGRISGQEIDQHVIHMGHKSLDVSTSGC